MLKGKRSFFKAVPCGKNAIAFLAAMFTAAGVHAQSLVPKELTTTANQVAAFFKSPVLVVIFGILIAAAGLAFAFNKDNEKIKHTCIAIIIGCVIMGGSATIAGMLLGQ
jgi:hypothetical protein